MILPEKEKIKLAVISDTHGKIDDVVQSISKNEPVHYILHAGDFLTDLHNIKYEIEHNPDLLKENPLGYYGVVGNCDGYKSPSKLLIEVSGLRILLLHGHYEGVKNGLLQLNYLAEEERSDIVIFGHTHIPVNIQENGVLFFNPGSFNYPRGGVKEPSYGIIEVSGNTLNSAEILYKKS
ncbi:metallophosphoesterase [Natranaerobius thermophilus]|uniref:Phosphoesterase n=1 Tax=Natranaerobius thermophilus (strain ATCC BAA-1301 / DSM 18059 / JW/NM-WN-LF) TaxID=457570 RepID=B2A6I6_NATTJ|nr:metallophosphoesterase [Natranaerobius thermophilus]ACB85519.1 phosphodiesterase, MJ0936 family [Natranaerobius thermophilus JW/NM-WN-LF]